MRVAWALVAVVLAAQPAAGQADAPDAPLDRATTLYLHQAGYQHMPISTQAPPESYEDNVALGVATASLSCFANPPAVGNPFQAYHTWRGFGFQGHMDYAEDPPRTVFDGGYGPSATGLDVLLSGEEVVLHWSWSVDAAAGSALAGSANLAPVPLAGVVVEATLRTGQELSVDDAAFDAGQILAHGRSEPAVLAGEQSSGVTYARLGTRDVYDFTVPLAIEQALIPAEQGFNLRVDTYVVRDECPAEGYLTPNTLAAHTSAEHRPRLEVVADDAPRVTAVAAWPLAGAPWGRMVVHANVTTPWGNQDVARVEMSLRSLDDPGFSASTVLAVEPVPQVHCHCPAVPLQRTWFWDAAADEAPPGRYLATVTVTSLQGEQVAQGHEFDLPAPQAAPGPGPALALLGLVGLAVLVRGRRAS